MPHHENSTHFTENKKHNAKNGIELFFLCQAVFKSKHILQSMNENALECMLSCVYR